MTAGNLGHSSQDDLAVTASGEGIGAHVFAGSVSVIYGSNSGLTAAGNQFLYQGDGIASGTPGDYAGFGWGLAVADLGHSGVADLAAGIPGEVVSAKTDAGAADVMYGSPSGLTGTGSQILTEALPATGVRFGSAVTASNFGKSSQADLAVGAPSENFGPATAAGQVDVFYGASGGPSPGSPQIWSQDSPGIQDTAEINDRFGTSLTDDPQPPD